ncbi:MAG: hypothetical protein R2758_00060 [Bacteroidales bacterium]
MKVDDCVFAYSDVTYQGNANERNSERCRGKLHAVRWKETMQAGQSGYSCRAVRTGCGKARTSRRVIELLMKKGLKVVAVRHPMPYGNLVEQKVQRFAVVEDLEKHKYR